MGAICDTVDTLSSKECGGLICEHGRVRRGGKECGGSQICEHGRLRSHARQRNLSRPLQHGRRARLQECGGVNLRHGRGALGARIGGSSASTVVCALVQVSRRELMKVGECASSSSPSPSLTSRGTSPELPSRRFRSSSRQPLQRRAPLLSRVSSLTRTDLTSTVPPRRAASSFSARNSFGSCLTLRSAPRARPPGPRRHRHQNAVTTATTQSNRTTRTDSRVRARVVLAETTRAPRVRPPRQHLVRASAGGSRGRARSGPLGCPRRRVPALVRHLFRHTTPPRAPARRRTRARPVRKHKWREPRPTVVPGTGGKHVALVEALEDRHRARRRAAVTLNTSTSGSTWRGRGAVDDDGGESVIETSD